MCKNVLYGIDFKKKYMCLLSHKPIKEIKKKE